MSVLHLFFLLNGRKADGWLVEAQFYRDGSHDDDRHPRAVGVHQVEHVLATLGEVGQPQEEAGH